MALPETKIAVYYGTITLNNGDVETYTAAQIAELYNVADRDYLEVSLTGPEPWNHDPILELSHVHLKPLPDGQYYDAVERYNLDHEILYDEDFNPHVGGKWAVPYRENADEPNDY